MSNETLFKCNNPDCEAAEEWDASQSHVPPGWHFITVVGNPMLFCENCSSHFDHMVNDNTPENISKYMKRQLEIED